MINNEISTYSFVVNYRGGTYISQVTASSIADAIPEWIHKIKNEIKEIKYLGPKTMAQIEELSANSFNFPVELKGLKNIWAVNYFTLAGPIYVNIILTFTNTTPSNY